MPYIEALTSLSQFLQLYGGWGVSVILLVAIKWLFGYQNKKQDIIEDKLLLSHSKAVENYEHQITELGNLLEKRHDQFIEIIQNCGATLKIVQEAIDRTDKNNSQLIILLTEIKQLLNQTK